MYYLKYFRLFCKILPLTYEEGLSYEKQLEKMIYKVKELVNATQKDWGDIATSAQKDLDAYVTSMTEAIRNESSAAGTQIRNIRSSLTEETSNRGAADTNIQTAIDNAKNAPMLEKPLNRLYVICGDSLMTADNGWGAFLENTGIEIATDLSAITSDDLTAPVNQLSRIKSTVDSNLVTNVALIGDINGLSGVSEFPSKARELFPNADILVANVQDGKVGDNISAELKSATEKAGGQAITGLEGLLATDSLNDAEKARVLGTIALGFVSPYTEECGAKYTAFGHTNDAVTYYNTARKAIGIGKLTAESPDVTELKAFAKNLTVKAGVAGSNYQTSGVVEFDPSEETPKAKRYYCTVSDGLYTQTTGDGGCDGLYGEVEYE